MLSLALFCSTGALNRIRPQLVQGKDWRLLPIPANEDTTMTTHVSLTGLAAAVMLFVTGVAMHEAARADHLTAGILGLLVG
jgi:hypothetical protein